MAAVDSIRQILRDLRGQKLRTFLTVFGIVWGTAAVSLLLAFGEGLHAQLLKNSAGLGNNIVMTWPALTSIPYEGLGKGRAIRLTERDVDLLRRKTIGLEAISAEYEAPFKLQIGRRVLSVDVEGVEPPFGEMRNLIPQAGGRFLNPIDEREKRRVAFIGNELSEQLFGSGGAVGQVVRLGGSPFTIVGVMKPKEQDSSYSGRDKGKLFIPAATFRALHGDKYIDMLIFQADSVAATGSVKKQVYDILARKHRFDPKDEEALQMWDLSEAGKFLNTFMLAFNLFLGIVGSMTLIVGGIGVSNIMNVVVEERTREIGIKMALGARPGRVLTQFMIETFAITATGGILGLGLTAAICAVVPSFGATEYIGVPEVSPFVATITAGLLGAIGFAAGWFPARSAAALDPVVAMKV